MIYITLIFSFLFESCISNIVPLNSFLTPLFFIVALTILYPYFKKNNFNFVIIAIICGLFYDLGFTNTPFINVISVSLISLLIILSYKYMHYNIVNSSIISMLMIIFYRIITYIIILTIGYAKFNISVLCRSIYNSLFINFMYGIILFMIIDSISKIFGIKRVE